MSSNLIRNGYTWSITRPADITAYNANDQLANSVTAGSVTAIQIPAQKKGGHINIRAASLSKSGAGTTNANFTLLLGNAPFTSPGDNAGYVGTYTELKGYLGHISFNVSNFVGLANGILIPGVFLNNTLPSLVCADLIDGNLYGIMLLNGAYTPSNAEQFQLKLAIDLE